MEHLHHAAIYVLLRHRYNRLTYHSLETPDRPTAWTLIHSEANVNPLTFVDAEAVSAGPSRKASLPSAEEQKEMAPFLSMLEDVLNRMSHLDRMSLNSSRVAGWPVEDREL